MALFRRRTKIERLQKKYEKLMKEWHGLSTVNRSASDEKYAEAQLVMNEIDNIKSNS